ncbi:MAG TPA: hypothetical protein VHD85_18335 [Terracidiphilus sp.]|nr:hypothetical protein [Terracidiphilus sp.]
MAAKRKSPDVLIDEESILETDARWMLAGRVARSSALHRATQLRDILLFIVRQTVLQPDDPISEFEIAHRVLGRRSDFNPLDDNIVRVQMAHLRKKLDLYFSTEGKDEEVVIAVALGTYKPVFSPRTNPSAKHGASEVDAVRKDLSAVVEEAAAEPVEVAAEPKPDATKSRQGLFLQIAAAVLVLALAGGCVALWLQVRSQRQQLDQIQHALAPWRDDPSLASLWSGFLDSNRDTDLIISDDSFLLMEEIAKKQTPFYGYLGRSYLAPQESAGLSPQLRAVQDLLASKSLGNTSEFKLAQRILGLDPLQKKVHLYSARQYMPALVRQDNIILIGGRISNPWSELFEGKLNFVESTGFEGLGKTTVINRAPASGEPHSYVSTDAVGYCVVAYLPNPGHEGKVLLIEGTSSEATEAAADFLLSPEQFSTFRNMLHTAQLPYFEVLLKTSQVRGTPLAATVEAYRTYPGIS